MKGVKYIEIKYTWNLNYFLYIKAFLRSHVKWVKYIEIEYEFKFEIFTLKFKFFCDHMLNGLSMTFHPDLCQSFSLLLFQ